MTHLVELSGNTKANNLMRMPVKELGDVEAGIWFMQLVGEIYPEMTIGDLYAGQTPVQMAGWWTDIKKAVGGHTKGVGNIVGSVGDKLGDWGGSIVRLVADEKVMNAGTRAAAAYFSGGASEGGQGLMSMFQGGEGGFDWRGLLATIGGTVKGDLPDQGAFSFGGVKPGYLALGAGVVLLLAIRR